MIALTFTALALAVSQAPPPGVAFDCRIPSGGILAPIDFQVFAPADKSSEGYRTDADQSAEDAISGVHTYTKVFETIGDELPTRLVLTWRYHHKWPVSLTIADYEAVGGTAKYKLVQENELASVLHKPLAPITFEGRCVARVLQEHKK